MRRARRRAGILLLVLGLAALAGCGEVQPQTEVVCEGCVGGVERAGAETGHPVAVEESATHIYLQRAGDARVQARLSLSGPGADAVRRNETLRERIAAAVAGPSGDESAATGHATRPAFQREDLRVSVDADELLVTYRVRNVTTRRFGATISQRFYRYDGENHATELAADEPFFLATDRLVVHGPPGTRPLVEPANATTRGEVLVWDDGVVDPRTYLVFGSGWAGGASGAGGRVLGHAAVATEVFAWAAPQAIAGIVVPTPMLLFLTLLLAVRYPGHVTSRGGWNPRSDAMFWVLVGASTFVLVGLAGLLVHWIVAVVGAVGAGLLVGVAWLVFHESDPAQAMASGSGGGSRAAGGDPIAPRGDSGAGGGAPGADASDLTVDAGGQSAGDTASVNRDRERESIESSTLRPGRWTVAAAGVSVLALVVVTVVVAADYGATYGRLVPWIAVLVPFLAFPALGFAVTRPARGDLRSVVVVAVTAVPWLVAFPLAVTGGNDWGAAFLLPLIWGVLAGFPGVLLFYAALGISSRWL